MAPSFTIWTCLFLVAGCIGVFLAGLILFKKDTIKTNWAIGLLVLGFSLILFQYVLFWTGYRVIYPHLYFFDSSWYLTFGPLLYIYFIKLYKHTHKTNYIHLLPAVLSFILSGYYLFQTQGFFNTKDVSGELLFSVQKSLKDPWLIVLSFLFYLWVIRDFIKFNKTENTQTESLQLRKNWTTILLRLFSVFILAYASYYVLVNFSFFNLAWDYAISVTMSIGIFTIGFFVLKKPEIFNGQLMITLFLPKKDNGYQINETTATEFYSQLIKHIETQKPYRNNELRLIHIAEEMGLSIHLLSQIINEKSGENFNHFINNYRLKEAAELLTQDNNLNIKSIYFDVGFNNKTTFYNAFKKKYKCTPTQYRERHFST